MNTGMTLHWRPSAGLTCYHAAQALWHQRPIADAELAGLLRAPADKLYAALREERVPPMAFWGHLVALAADWENPRQLAERVLIKCIGQTETPIRIRRFQTCFEDLRQACGKFVAAAGDSLTRAAETARQRWSMQGPDLLAGIRQRIEDDILADEARVLVVLPVCGGGGSAFLPYNCVTFEAVAADPVPALPEALRLAWLLAQLHLDVPRISENVPRERLPAVASLAMIPVALAAAEHLQVARADEATIRLALQSWVPAGERVDSLTATLVQWWDVYRAMKPAFGSALQALDRLLDA